METDESDIGNSIGNKGRGVKIFENNGEISAIDKEKKEISSKTRTLNDLSGKQWLQWSKSIWRFTDPVKNNYGHPAIFPDFVAERLIKIFTHEGDFVIDPFVGIGTTVVVSKQLNRNALGIELVKRYVDIGKRRLEQETLLDTVKENKKRIKTIHQIIHDDARNLLCYIDPNSVDFCLTSPPYWCGLHGKNGLKYTGQTHKEVKVYSESDLDLGNIQDYNLFFEELKEIFSKVYITLKERKYCVIIIQDARRGSKVYPMHIDCIRIMGEIGFDYQDLIIWEHPFYTTRPLGFPTTFVVSRVHDFILIFRKNLQREGELGE